MGSVLSRLNGIERAETAGGVPLVSGSFPEGEHDRVRQALRDEHDRTGLWPVLGWTAWTAAEFTHGWDFGPQGPGLLAAVREIDPAERMALIVGSVLEEAIDFTDPADPETMALIEEEKAYFDPVRVAEAAARLTKSPRRSRWQTESYPPTDVLLVPATAGHEAIALVPGIISIMNNWSGGRSHPNLEYADHVLVLKHWEATRGAQLYYCGGADLELRVARPPRDPLAAATCAIEQISYCYDLSQTVGGVDDVARTQAVSDHWSFWWD